MPCGHAVRGGTPRDDQPSRTHRDGCGRGRGGPRRGGAGTLAGHAPGACPGDTARSIRIAALHRGVVGIEPARGRSPCGGPDSGDPRTGPASEPAVSRALRAGAAALAALPGPDPGRFCPALSASAMSRDAVTPPYGLREAFLVRSSTARFPLDRTPVEAAGARLRAGLVHEAGEGAPDDAARCRVVRAAGISGAVPAPGVGRGPKHHHSGGPSPGVRYHGRHGVAHLLLALAAQPEPARPWAHRLPPVPAG